MAVHGEFVQNPVVQWAMILETEVAQGMGNAFQGIRNAVRIVIHRIDAPLVTGLVVGRIANPVDRWIPHVDIGRGHVDFQPENVLTFLELAIAHAAKQFKILINRSVTIGAVLAGFRQGPPVLADFLSRERVNIGFPLPDQLLGKLVKLIKVVGRKLLFLPFES